MEEQQEDMLVLASFRFLENFEYRPNLQILTKLSFTRALVRETTS